MSRYGQRTRPSTAISTWTQGDLLNPRVETDFLVVAGGGSCRSFTNAPGFGCGAGGFRSSYSTQGKGVAQASKLVLLRNINYPVVIGAGGSNSNGSTSSIDGSVSGALFIDALGGSGNFATFGGGAAVGGTTNTATGGTYGYDGVNRGGGGVGEAGSTDGAHQGGDGLENLITGTSVFYGGGGGGNNGDTGQVGGNGGGGKGSDYSTDNATAGTANTGGGGGGGWAGLPNSTANGGSGVVILRFPTIQATATIGAGLTGTTTTDGAFTVVRITAGSGNVSFG